MEPRPRFWVLGDGAEFVVLDTAYPPEQDLPRCKTAEMAERVARALNAHEAPNK